MGYLIRHLLIPLVCAIGVSTVLTYLVRSLTHRLGLLDKPGKHKQHAAPTPTLGGVPVFLGFVAGCLASGDVSVKLVCILQASSFLVAVGTLDDIRGVSAKFKLLSLFLACCWLCKGGISLDAFGLPSLGALLLTFLWVGFVSSSFNGVDNADGAAAGLAVISAIATFAISWASWQHDLALVSLVLGGACVGFLFFNFPKPRASIFLGDSGSLFLGFSLATMTVLGQWSSTGWKSAVIALLLVFVPSFDFLFILLSRGFDGRYKSWGDPVTMCGRDHFSHRLRYLGLTPRQSLAVLYGLASAASYAAYQIAQAPHLLNWKSLAQASAGLIVLAIGLKQVPLPQSAFTEE